MKVLVVGKGGREHALVWKIAQSPLVSEVFCAPGNTGIAQLAECVSIDANNVEGLIEFVEEKTVDLTVVGPEEPLFFGRIEDRFRQHGLRIFGPNPTAASIEASKLQAKLFMQRHNIPTADFMIFGQNLFSAGGAEEATKHAISNLPRVIKANGLAAGKGVFLCFTEAQVLAAIDKIMIRREFNDRDSVVIEELLKGQEITFTVLTDGNTVIPLLSTQDHKPLLDDDEGPNTGGMGAYAPVPFVTQTLQREILETILYPTLKGLREEGWGYRGVLYAGLMITKEGPKVLEFNCRFGDPETQPLLLLMESDIVPILKQIADGSLSEEKLQWSAGAAVCVVMTSRGYPDNPELGKEIAGLEAVEEMKGVIAFHAGTSRENGIWKTAGGRVLGITAEAKDIPTAIQLVNTAVSKVSWDGEHHRTDIGRKALRYGVNLKQSFN